MATILNKKEIRFGTDGWRAKIAEDFTYDNVRKVAWSLGQILLKDPAHPCVFVGFDRRFCSDQFAHEAAGVLAGLGVPTYLAQTVLPTPAFSYLAKKHKSYALVVTASHNPPRDNGLKIKNPDGASASPTFTNQVENLIVSAPENFIRAKCLREEGFKKEYMDYLKFLARGIDKKLKGKKVVIDYLHGSSAGLLEEIIGSQHVIALRSANDPYFGGIAPEPVEKNMKELQAKVKQSKAILGVALDGDGDRIAVVDEKGNYMAPTTVFPVYAYYYALALKQKGEIVQGVSLGFLGELIAQKAGLPFCWVPVGFKNIAQRMKSTSVLLGGEESGGYALGELLPDRDGLVNTLIMLKILTELKLKPSQLVAKIFKEFGPSHYERFDHHISEPVDSKHFTALCKEALVPRIQARGLKTVHQLEIDGLKLFFDDGSWLLLRPSGTEALIRVYAETSNKNDTKELIALASGWIKETIS